MIEKSGVASKLAGWLLGTLNLIVMVFCLVVFSLCLWVISSPTTLSNVIREYEDHTLNALLPPEVLVIQNGVGLAALAIFFSVIAFMGFYGSVTRSQFLLFMYSALVLLLLLLECALTYYFSSTLIEKGLQERDGQWTHALRLIFRCCDVSNSSDTLKPPWSCCGPEYYPENCTFAKLYEKGCQSSISSWIDRHIAAVYSSLAALHVLLASCSLVRRASSTSRSHS